MGQIKGKRHNPQRNSYDTIQTADTVQEEHAIVRQKLENGNELLWEIDILGSDKSLLHIECPFCTSPSRRTAMTVTKVNKNFYIETLSEPIKHTFFGPRGRGEIPITKLLTVTEPITCSYCNVTFRINGGVLTRGV